MILPILDSQLVLLHFWISSAKVNVITLLNTFTFGFELLQIISSLPLNGTKPASAG